MITYGRLFLCLKRDVVQQRTLGAFFDTEGGTHHRFSDYESVLKG